MRVNIMPAEVYEAFETLPALAAGTGLVSQIMRFKSLRVRESTVRYLY